MKTTEQRIKELESLKDHYYSIIDALINLDDVGIERSQNMRSVIDECNHGVVCCNNALKEYK